jgi:5-methylcytosine-specific restriction endonuclease McrA
MSFKPCLKCGALSRGGYCPVHEPKPHVVRPSPSSRNRPAPSLRRKIKARDGDRCQRCGRPGTLKNPLRVHDRRRVADGGTHADLNLETLRRDCHADVHNR